MNKAQMNCLFEAIDAVLEWDQTGLIDDCDDAETFSEAIERLRDCYREIRVDNDLHYDGPGWHR